VTHTLTKSCISEDDLRQLATIAGLKPEVYWTQQDVDKVARVSNMVRSVFFYLILEN